MAFGNGTMETLACDPLVTVFNENVTVINMLFFTFY